MTVSPPLLPLSSADPSVQGEATSSPACLAPTCLPTPCFLCAGGLPLDPQHPPARPPPHPGVRLSCTLLATAVQAVFCSPQGLLPAPAPQGLSSSVPAPQTVSPLGTAYIPGLLCGSGWEARGGCRWGKRREGRSGQGEGGGQRGPAGGGGDGSRRGKRRREGGVQTSRRPRGPGTSDHALQPPTPGEGARNRAGDAVYHRSV